MKKVLSRISLKGKEDEDDVQWRGRRQMKMMAKSPCEEEELHLSRMRRSLKKKTEFD